MNLFLILCACFLTIGNIKPVMNWPQVFNYPIDEFCSYLITNGQSLQFPSTTSSVITKEFKLHFNICSKVGPRNPCGKVSSCLKENTRHFDIGSRFIPITSNYNDRAKGVGPTVFGLFEDLGLVLSTLIPANKRDCNAINELAYTFRYVVESPGVGVVSQHWEERLSDLVHGSYSFLEPTGKIRLVEYQVSGKHGFRAAVTFRKPPGIPLVGHLQYPDYYRAPIVFAKPVGLITRDLFRARKTYPNLTV